MLDKGGHLTYLHNNEWILNDTYPQGARRIQTPHLYQIATNRRIDLGEFPSPREYTGEWRVDTHPRSAATNVGSASTRPTPARAGSSTSSTSAR